MLRGSKDNRIIKAAVRFDINAITVGNNGNRHLSHIICSGGVISKSVARALGINVDYKIFAAVGKSIS